MRRTQPISAEKLASTPLLSPITVSVDPPPRSTTTKGAAAGSSSPTAPAKDSAASSVPVMTSAMAPGITAPSSSAVIAKNTSRLETSRAADVATMRTRSTPSDVISWVYAASAARVRSMASGANSPVASTP
ncbi:Uncharacterised protein [Mycobacteroides abscessus subsp. abscessus]|nr:Uncharacterised protein [Mycobacteroides abscessus subsp. abscessus]